MDMPARQAMNDDEAGNAISLVCAPGEKVWHRRLREKKAVTLGVGVDMEEGRPLARTCAEQ